MRPATEVTAHGNNQKRVDHEKDGHWDVGDDIAERIWIGKKRAVAGQKLKPNPCDVNSDEKIHQLAGPWSIQQQPDGGCPGGKTDGRDEPSIVVGVR